MRRKMFTFLLMLVCYVLFACSGINVQAADETQEVNIPNEYLKKLINVTLNKEETSPVTKQEMESLTELNTQDIPLIDSTVKTHTHGISDLTGLEYAVNLEKLYLQMNEISDLTPISGLTKLKELNLHRNELVDISPLSKLKNLEELDIYNNKIQDISPLSRLTNLTFLDMHYVNRQEKEIDITPLSGLTNLQYLSLESNLIHNIDCLKPVIESGNLKTILLRVNYISDFRVLKPMLNELYIDNFGSSEEMMIGTINQKAEGQAIEVHGAKEGQKIEVPLPEIKGFEDIDAFWAEMYEVSTTKTVSFLEDIEGASVSYDTEKNVAVIELDENLVGSRKDINANLQIAYETTDFTYYIPVHITQDVKYDFKLNISDINKLILHIDTRNGMYISEEELVGTIVDAEGKPVQLKDVSVEFIGNALYGINQEQFQACDLRVEGNQVFFKIAGKEGETIEEGNYTLEPTIKFQINGDDATYQVPDTFKIYNLYVSPTDPLNLENNIVFDLSKPNPDGTFTSEKYKIQLPNDRKIHWIDVNNSQGERILSMKGEDAPDGFTLTLRPDQMKDVFYVRVMMKSIQRDAPIELLNIGTKFIYSQKNDDIESTFKTNIPASVKEGTEIDLIVSNGEDVCKNYGVSSSDNKIIEIDGNKLRATGIGKSTIELKNLLFDYNVNGIVFREVEYKPSLLKEISVTKADTNVEKPADTSTNKPVEKPSGTSINKPSSKKDNPPTGDHSNINFWAVLAAMSLLTIAIAKTKKKSGE